MLSKTAQLLWLGARDRARRRSLRFFLQSLSILMEAGLELSYAWNRASSELGSGLGAGLQNELAEASKGSLSHGLEALERTYPDPRYRFWFGLIGELYRSGGSVLKTVEAFADALERDEDLEWSHHLQSVPLRITFVLAFFFLVPALALVLIPLLNQASQGF
jgi:pilus assembly protein TadC